MITPSDYKTVADHVADYVDDILSAQSKMTAIHDTLPLMVGSVDYKANLDYAAQLSAFYLGVLGNTPKDLIVAVGVLNKWVTGGSSLDAYLAANNIMVKQSFANVSSQAGYPIDPTHIE